LITARHRSPETSVTVDRSVPAGVSIDAIRSQLNVRSPMHVSISRSEPWGSSYGRIDPSLNVTEAVTAASDSAHRVVGRDTVHRTARERSVRCIGDVIG
jgi:hypothetical protein